MIGRIKRDAALARVNAELSARVLPARGSRPARTGFARMYGAAVVGGEERTIISALMAGTTLLLMIACVNLANLGHDVRRAWPHCRVHRRGRRVWRGVLHGGAANA